MAKAILICGAICSGKTTYAKKYMEENPAVLLSMDELMLALFPPQLGDMHDEISAKCRAYLLERAAEIIRAGMDVILDWGFWKREDRKDITGYFCSRGICVSWVYVECTEKTLDERIKKRNGKVERGENTAYFVDENLKRKCLGRFEPPVDGETDVVVRA